MSLKKRLSAACRHRHRWKPWRRNRQMKTALPKELRPAKTRRPHWTILRFVNCHCC
jgi:hypothetical protein